MGDKKNVRASDKMEILFLGGVGSTVGIWSISDEFEEWGETGYCILVYFWFYIIAIRNNMQLMAPMK